MTDNPALRRSLKQARQALTENERIAAAAAAIKNVLELPCYRKARRLAAFIGSNGELDPYPLMLRAERDGKSVYLPVLHPFRKGRLLFCQWHPGATLRRNRFGIPEPLPASSTLLPARHLDLVVMPLLGFDDHCHRLGMGGGYYDRTFAFRQRTRFIRRPVLIGFAHELQRVATLQHMPWDVSPDFIVTNQRIHRCTTR